MHPHEGSSVEVNYARRTRRQRQCRLPPGLRSDVLRLRRDDLAHDVLTTIFDRVEEMAQEEGVARSYSTLMGRAVYVPSVHERRILWKLEADASFRGMVRRQIRQHLRAAHTLPPDPNRIPWVPNVIPEVRVPRDGRVIVRSSVGADSASTLEAVPEELDVYVHDRIVDEWRRQHPESDDYIDEPEDVRVYVFGAAGGGFARVVTSRRALRPRIHVHEADLLIPTTTNLPCVVGERGRLVAGTVVDCAYVLLRAPGVGGAVNHGAIYTDEPTDPSRMGPSRWCAYTQALLKVISSHVMVGGMVFIVPPESLRTDNGYEPAPELRKGVENLASAGLECVARHELREVDPLNQPFVGRRRPSRSLIIAKKTGTVRL